MTPILANIAGWEAPIVLLLILLLFGGERLPRLARSLGQALKEFRDGLAERDATDDEN